MRGDGGGRGCAVQVDPTSTIPEHRIIKTSWHWKCCSTSTIPKHHTLTLWVPAVFTGLMLRDGVGRVCSYLAASTSTIPSHWAVSTRYKFCCFQFWVEIGYVCLFSRLPKTSIHVVGTLRVKMSEYHKHLKTNVHVCCMNCWTIKNVKYKKIYCKNVI